MNIKIKDRILKLAVSNLIERWYSDFSKKTLKAAGVPSKKELQEQILGDERFLKSLEKALATRIENDMIFDIVFYDNDVRSKILIDYEKKCNNHDYDLEQKQNLESLIKRVEGLNYTVTRKNSFYIDGAPRVPHSLTQVLREKPQNLRPNEMINELRLAGYMVTKNKS